MEWLYKNKTVARVRVPTHNISALRVWAYARTLFLLLDSGHMPALYIPALRVQAYAGIVYSCS